MAPQKHADTHAFQSNSEKADEASKEAQRMEIRESVGILGGRCLLGLYGHFGVFIGFGDFASFFG